MNQLLTPALLASMIAASVSCAGLLAVWCAGGWAQRNVAFCSAFVAGILLTTALGLVPAAISASPSGLYFVLLGYAGLYFINLVFVHKNASMAALAPLLAISTHSFLDGIEYGVLFQYEYQTALIASSGLILHEFAEAIILFVLLSKAGWRRIYAIGGAFLGAALTTPLGALVAEHSLPLAHETTLTSLVALAAGALLYVGTVHLTGPMMANANRIPTLLAYILGIVLALAAQKIGHGQHASPYQQPSPPWHQE